MEENTEYSGLNDTELTRVEANEQKQAILEARSLNNSAFSELARWVIASLLAVNSGGLLTILNADSVSLDGKFWAGLAFAGGICAALLTGYANMQSAKSAMPEINKQLGYWIGVSLHGERSEEIETELGEDWKKALKSDSYADALGWLSFILLIVGLGIGGANLVKQPSEPKIEKHVIEVVIEDD